MANKRKNPERHLAAVMWVGIVMALAWIYAFVWVQSKGFDWLEPANGAKVVSVEEYRSVVRLLKMTLELFPLAAFNCVLLSSGVWLYFRERRKNKADERPDA